MSLLDLLQYRRSVRYYDPDKPLNSEKVRHCLQQAALSPSSSNMQLYEFYHITDKSTLQQLAHACFNQQPATTAQQMVVFVVRQDLYRQRAAEVMVMEQENVKCTSPPEKQASRIKVKERYYGWLMPFIYARCCGLLGVFRRTIALLVHYFRPMQVDVSEADMRIVSHKSCGLAAQTFMLAMAENGYDTCPMEGLDSLRVKNILKLPRGAEINMIVACGIRKDGRGIWGERTRLPFDKIYKHI